MTGAYEDLRALEVPIGRACTLIGRSRATHYRHLKAPVEGPRKPRAVPDNGQVSVVT
jgi:putative transposase